MIALRYHKRNLFHKAFGQEMLVVLDLPDTPAGSGKDYAVTPRTLRATYDAGFTHTRAHSMDGIVAIWDFGQKQLRGRFRLSVRQQSFMVLTGWAGNAPLIYTGEFVALPNQQAGTEILKRVNKITGVAYGPGKQISSGAANTE